MAQFTPAQIETIAAEVKGQCEFMERTNIWAFNFRADPRRGRSIHALFCRGAESIGFVPAHLTPLDVIELMGVVLDVVREYDRRNNIAPAI